MTLKVKTNLKTASALIIKKNITFLISRLKKKDLKIKMIAMFFT